MPEPLLRVENLTVSFEGFTAIDNLSLEIMPQTVRVLIGPNGAGKSTLLDTIIGRVRPAKGRVLFKGKDLRRLPEYQIVRRGICRKFQAPGVLESLTVYENLILAHRHSRSWVSMMRQDIGPQMRSDVEQILELTGLKDRRNSQARHLAHGQKQWLEIGMVVASQAELLLLDEPAAGMTHEESAMTASLIRNLSKTHTLMVIDHDMGFIAQLEAPVSVLHMGRLLSQGTLEQVRKDPQVISVYLGRVKEGAC